MSDSSYVASAGEEEDNEIEGNESNNRLKKGKAFSLAWEFCTKIDAAHATCNICGQTLKYTASVSNLMKHVRNRHGSVLARGGVSGRKGPKQMSSGEVWKHFTCIDAALKIARCNVCSRRVVYESAEDLQGHYDRKHGGEGDEIQTVMVGSDGDLYKMEEVEEVESDAQEEEVFTTRPQLTNVKSGTKLRPNKSTKQHSTPNKKRQHSYHLEETPKKLKKEQQREELKNPETDSTELFSKYITSLLKRLPRNVTDILQANIVKQILDAIVANNNSVTAVPEYRNNNMPHLIVLPSSTNANCVTSIASDPDVRFSNEVIGYFEFESAGDRSKCTVCGETVSNQVEDQRAHLEDQHAALLAKIIRDEKESSEIDQDESRQDEDIFQEVLYLEEDAEHVMLKPRKPKKIKTEPKRKHSIYEDREQYSQHSEPYIIKKQRSDDEIDSFLKYISVLIRKIPKEHSPKLQMDIISLIMNTQIAASTNTSIGPNTSSVTGPVTSVPEYTITVTNSDET